jgi:hypothetical protein
MLYNTAMEERKTAWERCHVSVNYSQQKAEVPDLKLDFPEYAEVHSQVLQDVLLRLERTIQAFFRRVKAGEKPGQPRFQGRHRYNSFTYPQYGNGVVLDGGLLSLSKIGRIPIRVPRPLEGTPKTVNISREADGWYACFSCAEVPMAPLPPTGQETGIRRGRRYGYYCRYRPHRSMKAATWSLIGSLHFSCESTATSCCHRVTIATMGAAGRAQKTASVSTKQKFGVKVVLMDRVVRVLATVAIALLAHYVPLLRVLYAA